MADALEFNGLVRVTVVDTHGIVQVVQGAGNFARLYDQPADDAHVCQEIVSLAQPTRDGARARLKVIVPASGWMKIIRTPDSVEDILQAFRNAGLEKVTPQPRPEGLMERFCGFGRRALGL